MKKTFEDFVAFIGENEFYRDLKIKGLFRESALSDIEQLSFIIQGNSLTAKNDHVRNKLYDIQADLNTVGDLMSLIEDAEESRKNRYMPKYNDFQGGISLCVLRNDSCKSSSYVKDFILKDGEILFDIYLS